MVSSLAAAVAKLKVRKDKVEEGNLITKNNYSDGSNNKRNDTSSTVAHPPNSRCNLNTSIISSSVKTVDTNTTRLKDHHNNQCRQEPKKLSSLASQLKRNSTSSKRESQLQEGKSKNKNIQRQKKHHVVASFIYDLSSESEPEKDPSNEQKQTHNRTSRFNRNLTKPRKKAGTISHDTKIPTQKSLSKMKTKQSYSSSTDMQQKTDPTLKILEKQDTKPGTKHTVQLLSSSQLDGTCIKIKQHSPIRWADDDSSSDSDLC